MHIQLELESTRDLEPPPMVVLLRCENNASFCLMAKNPGWSASHKKIQIATKSTNVLLAQLFNNFDQNPFVEECGKLYRV